MAKYWFEELTSLDVDVDIASEFRYRKNRFKKETLYVFVSQSGETADTYAALDLCKNNGMKTCSVVNVIKFPCFLPSISSTMRMQACSLFIISHFQSLIYFF